MQVNSKKSVTASMIPTNLQQILQELGLPSPVGTDDNGLPFWQINDQTIHWAQMQQFIWLRQQQMGTGKGTGSIEQGPNLGNLDISGFNLPDTKIENNVEKGLETAHENLDASFEQEGSAESQATASQNSQATKATKNSNKSKTLVGDSAPVMNVDLTDPHDVNNFVQEHINDPVTSSGRFMAEVLRKVLRALSLG